MGVHISRILERCHQQMDIELAKSHIPHSCETPLTFKQLCSIFPTRKDFLPAIIEA